MSQACAIPYPSPVATLAGVYDTSCLDFLQQMSLFAGIDENQLWEIAGDMVERRFRRGRIIFHEGDRGQTLYFIRSGVVRIFVNGLNGSETTLLLCSRPGDIFGELAAVDGRPRSATAIAFSPTVLYSLHGQDLYKHMRTCPQLAVNFVNELSLRVRYNTEQVNGLASQGISNRLARGLTELAQAHGRRESEGVRIDLPLTQCDLASLISTTRESINKWLGEFQRQGWVRVQYKQITILDAQALQALAQS
ncbi:MAG TPA: Crp/Fnr family transcriptional regulator [Anaerolineae bacterium]